MKSRPAEEILGFSTGYQEYGYGAEIATEAASPCKHGEKSDEKHLSIEYNVATFSGYRYTMIRIIEKVYGLPSSRIINCGDKRDEKVNEERIFE
mgnify:CR=1 FL=1|jgi:hypothetical protein